MFENQRRNILLIGNDDRACDDFFFREGGSLFLRIALCFTHNFDETAIFGHWPSHTQTSRHRRPSYFSRRLWTSCSINRMEFFGGGDVRRGDLGAGGLGCGVVNVLVRRAWKISLTCADVQLVEVIDFVKWKSTEERRKQRYVRSMTRWSICYLRKKEKKSICLSVCLLCWMKTERER